MTHGDQVILLGAVRESYSQMTPEYGEPGRGEMVAAVNVLGPELAGAWIKRLKARRVLQ